MEIQLCDNLRIAMPQMSSALCTMPHIHMSSYVTGPEKTRLTYLHINFDLNFSLSNVITHFVDITNFIIQARNLIKLE